MKNYFYATILLLFSLISAQAQFKKDSPTVTKYDGLFDFFYDESTDKIFLEVTQLEEEFLYVYSLSSGIGSNDIGLDRGQLGNEQVVYFKKVGPKLVLVQPNLKYRAITDNKLEAKSVQQAFASSILFGFPIISESKGTYLIEITDFLMQDTHGVANRLRGSGQGSYSLDKSKSAFDLERTKSFEKNIEFDVMLTFSGEPKGYNIRSVTPNASLVTVAQHHSFIALPDDGYKKREFDPRSGSYPFSYYDYATPVQEPILKRFITRHRLEKKNPEALKSEAVEPIVYYLDNGTPEPVRSALLEGGRWWNQAFEAAGYTNAFQLKMLPDDADPMDVRYNVIQWVHRSTRGWSYGSSITDPRTGEIIKGHVSLGSLRIRQDFLIAQALMNMPFADRDDTYEPMLNLALARIRQLSAHEIGHTLGFAHNFAASTVNRSSVMDYPHPQFALENGEVTFTNPYAIGIGEWDKYTVAYSYLDFGDASESEVHENLQSLLADAYSSGYRYISDADARAAGGAHATGHLWDNGNDIDEELEAVLELRKKAISNFGVHNIKKGEPYAVLEDVFAPLYFFHRYQTEAVAKSIGGLHYNYATKGDGQLIVETIAKSDQEKALRVLLKTLSAEELAIPEDKLALFPPRAIGYGRSRESFQGRTGVSFDALAAPETAADITLGFLLHPERASRLIQQKSRNTNLLGLDNVLQSIISATILKKEGKSQYLNTVQETINFRVLFHIMNLAAHTNVHPQVNAIAQHELQNIWKETMKTSAVGPIFTEMQRRIKQFSDHPETFKVLPVVKIPDGSPIGMDCFK